MNQSQRTGPSSVRVGLLQMSPEPSPARNLQKALQGIDEAARRGAKIICLEELFLTRYFPQTEAARHFKLAEPIPGPTTRALAEAARKHKVVILGSIFEKRAGGIYHNSAVLIGPEGKLLGKYRKMHLPDDPGFYEKFYFTPGDLGFQSFSTPHGRIGMLVCWDQWFPEAARLTALSGAEILFYPSAIGWAAGESPKVRKRQQSAWELIQRSHAVANGVFVCAVNRVGREGKIKFWGSSFVADPFGGLVAKAGPEREEILIADCDLSKIRQTREDWPFLRDRRIDAYGALTSRFLDPRT
ncbi:MAG: carbon-nitrogen hydrolase [Candidatus Omnitrophica bacterium]|nr:carbon-nitrogen hydrolase [Candidatus Omnitrophota bacterium]